MTPRNAGTIFGIGNTASCIGGLIAVPCSGWLFDSTQSWDAVFILFAAHYVGGALLWAILASDQPLKLDGEVVYTSVDCNSDDEDDENNRGGGGGGGMQSKDNGYPFTQSSSTLTTATASNTTPMVIATALTTSEKEYDTISLAKA